VPDYQIMYFRGKIIAKLVYGLDQLSCQAGLGDILVTAKHADAYDGKTFSKKLREFNKNVLRKLFPKGVGVVTRSSGGRLHFHVACNMPGLCASFDWISFEQSERYFKLYKKTKSNADLNFYRYYTAKYRRSLPKDWQVINRKLMQAGKRYGLGRVFLTPIRKNKTAYKWYLVSNVPYKRDTRDKGVHFFLSWGVNRAVRFQVLNKYTKEYRSKLNKFSTDLQLNSENYTMYLRGVLGSNWYYQISDLIKDINNLNISQQRRYRELQNTLRIHQLRLHE
jgi:hypothetical protein